MLSGAKHLEILRLRLRMTMVVLLLTACAPREQDFQPPHAPPQIAGGMFRPGDGAELPVNTWKAKKPLAVIVFLHGFGDYRHGVEEAAKYFAERGITTYAYDQRGFGQTEQRGIWAGERNLVSDAKQMVALARQKNPRVPVFLLGESMGGAVAALAADAPVKGVILSAPAVWGGDDFDPLLRTPLWLVAHTVPFWELPGNAVKRRASDNVPMLLALGRDPLVQKEARVDTTLGVVRLMDAAYDTAGEIGVPVLLLYGEHDEIIPPEPVRDFEKRLRAPHDFIVYPDGWHLLLRDLEGRKVQKDVADWVLKESH